MQEEGMSARADAAFDALSNWYENSLNAGCGFKSEQERQEYIKSLGDPMKHPMFAETTEDLEGHPLTEAFRCLREEDKSLVELAAMYKEEGNDWIKKNNKKSLTEAYDRYSHALGFIDKAIVEKEHDLDLKIEETLDSLNKMKSQILSNRAMASLSLTNYGSCRRDCDIAVRLWPGNVKAHYRRCKAQYQLKQFVECIESCNEALQVDTTNKDIMTFLTKSKDEVTRRNTEKVETRGRLLSELHGKWTAVWELALQEKVSLGYCSNVNPPPIQLRDSYPTSAVDAPDTSCWPVLLLYPQYGTFDIIQAAGSHDMLVEHLGVILPERGDYEQRIDWDRDEEYQASNVVVYASLHMTQKVDDLQQWLTSCENHYMITTGDTAIAPLTEVKGLLTNSQLNLADIKRDEILKESQFLEAQSALHSRQAHKTRFLDVHLGCRFWQVLRAKGMIVSGGILSLVIFPRDNLAHKKFLRENAAEGNDIVQLLPV